MKKTKSQLLRWFCLCSVFLLSDTCALPVMCSSNDPFMCANDFWEGVLINGTLTLAVKTWAVYPGIVASRIFHFEMTTSSTPYLNLSALVRGSSE